MAPATVRLRVWFNDGTNGSKQLSPDQRIAAVGFALNAATVNGTSTDGSIVVNATASGNGATIFGNSTGSGSAVIGNCLGTAGTAGYFQNFNAGNGASALIAQNLGGGPAGSFIISSAANSSNALSATTPGNGTAVIATTTGNGNAGYFTLSNPASIQTSLYATSNGSGYAFDAVNTGGGPAIHASASNNGVLQVNQANPGNVDIAYFYHQGVLVAGIAAGGTFGTVSDRNLKTDIKPLGNALKSISEISGVRYKWKRDGSIDVGVIAQEVEAVLPEAVAMNPQGNRIVSYTKLIPLLIEGMKEQNAHVVTLVDENAALKARLEKLEKLVEKLAGSNAAE